MKVFFQIKFSITAKEETQIEEELSNYVLTWLESKYGVAAKRAISACKSLLSDSEFGDPNGLFVETVHYEDVKYAGIDWVLFCGGVTMANGANGVHLQLREALEDYIKSQYFGKSPILLSAVQNKLDQEGILYQKPYIESSPAYKSELNGIQKSSKLPDWVKAYFDALANADLGVYSSPFCHQVEALEAAFAGKDLFVSTGTGSGKTECFMWPLLAKLAAEARNTPANWSMRGVRTIIMYPMNALVSDQVSRLRRLIGDSEHRFVNVFRETCGEDSRRPQFGMYTGRTPYAGKEPKRSADRSLVATYSEMLNAETDEEKAFLQKLIKDGKFPVKEDFHEFLRKLYDSNHIPDDEDAELVTRFEMQRFCPDILITNYCSTHGYYPPAITQSSLDTQLRIRPARKYGQIMWDTVSRKIRSFRPVYEK